jgi:toxin ParE1/3/4
LRIFPSALADADTAQDWYNGVQPSLGDAFTAELTQVFNLLLRQPGIGSKRYAYLLSGNALRFWSMDRFPFLIFYRAVDKELQILRILHERRDIPTAWVH